MARQQVSLSSFTNPLGERVHQVFFGGQPITRELGYVQARATALSKATKNGQNEFSRWDADINGGETWTEAVQA